MTGLDLSRDGLIEVSCLVTDGELNILDDGINVVIKPPPEQLAGMNDFVREMHVKSGLLDELDSGVDLVTAEDIILTYLKKYVPKPRSAPLAGNTIGTDRSFLAKDMPNLEAHCHYRNVDVSSIKELAKRWFPKAYRQAPAKAGNHRALADIKESITELCYYREEIFIPITKTAK